MNNSFFSEEMIARCRDRPNFWERVLRRWHRLTGRRIRCVAIDSRAPDGDHTVVCEIDRKTKHVFVLSETRAKHMKDEKMRNLEKEPRYVQIIISTIAAILLPFYLAWTLCKICAVYAHVILLVRRNDCLRDKLEKNQLKINVRYEGLRRDVQSQKQGTKEHK